MLTHCLTACITDRFCAKWLKRSVLCSVLFDELSSLGGLPQKVSVVVRVGLSVTLCGGHSGNGTPKQHNTGDN